jgi:hypothetical protein
MKKILFGCILILCFSATASFAGTIVTSVPDHLILTYAGGEHSEAGYPSYPAGPYNWFLTSYDGQGNVIGTSSFASYCMNFRWLDQSFSYRVTASDVSASSYYRKLAWMMSRAQAFGGNENDSFIQWAVWFYTLSSTQNPIDANVFVGFDDLVARIESFIAGAQYYQGQITYYQPVNEVNGGFELNAYNQGLLVFNNVPEPGMLLLVGLGLAGVATLKRKF